jgi:hypothetical protein
MIKTQGGPILYRCMILRKPNEIDSEELDMKYETANDTYETANDTYETANDTYDGVACPNCFIQRGKLDQPFSPCKGCKTRIEEEVHWACFQKDRDYTTADIKLYISHHSAFFNAEDIERDWPMIDFGRTKAGDRVVVMSMEGKCASCYEHHFPCLECNQGLNDLFYSTSLSFAVMSHAEYASTFHFGPRIGSREVITRHASREVITRHASREVITRHASRACELPSVVKAST